MRIGLPGAIVAAALTALLPSGGQAADESRSASSARCRGRRRRSASTSATASCSRVKLNGGKLGGLPAEVLVSDDQFKPDVAKQLFEKNIKRDKVDFMTGVVFSNIMLAALPEALDNKVDLHQPERGAVVDRRQGLQPAASSPSRGRTTPTTRPPASTPTRAT